HENTRPRKFFGVFRVLVISWPIQASSDSQALSFQRISVWYNFAGQKPPFSWRSAMSGHSKWHSIKHKKGAADAKRGKVFTRLIKELTVAARAGGGDPDMNPRLRTIVAEAKANNMPRENIERAIRRGTGQEPGVSFEEVQYEAYGPGGAALIIDALTDNKNRAVGEIRHILEK